MTLLTSSRKLRFLLYGGVGVLLLIGAILYFSPVSKNQQKEQELKIRFGLSLQPSSGLVIVALEQGYFQKNGLKLIVNEYPSGKRALIKGFFKGLVDVTSSSDLPVTLGGMGREDFRCISSIFRTDDMNSIVARRDAGIEKATDLKGKRIATQKGSAVHYFLHLFLLEHGLSEKDIQLSFMQAEQLPVALADGRIDAFSMRAPYIDQAEKLLGDNALTMTAPGLYDQQDVILVAQFA